MQKKPTEDVKKKMENLHSQPLTALIHHTHRILIPGTMILNTLSLRLTFPDMSTFCLGECPLQFYGKGRFCSRA